jgi:ribose transport system permease protein
MLNFLKKYGTLFGFLSIVAFFSIQLPTTFLTAQNIINISQQISMLAVVAFSMTIVMVMNDFDLSVGSMASLSGVIAAVLFTMDYPVWLAVSIALFAGVIGGTFNGILVAVVGILPFVATLGTLTMFSGLAFVVSGGKTIFGRDIPEEFSAFARSSIELNMLSLKLPYLSTLSLLVLLLVWFVLEQTVAGRHLYSIGGNREAAYLAGIKVKILKVYAFALTGFGAAIAGLMYASRVASANPTQGSGLMLDAIAAVFLGMTMSSQGEARVGYTLVGVLILGVLDNGLTQMRVDSYIREILVGLIVILAVASSSINRKTES